MFKWSVPHIFPFYLNNTDVMWISVRALRFARLLIHFLKLRCIGIWYVYINKYIVKSSSVSFDSFWWREAAYFYAWNMLPPKSKRLLIWFDRNHTCPSHPHSRPSSLAPTPPNMCSIYSQIKDFRLWIWSIHKYCVLCTAYVSKLISRCTLITQRKQEFYLFTTLYTVTKVLISCMQFRSIPLFFLL